MSAGSFLAGPAAAREDMEFNKNRLNFWVDLIMFVDMVMVALVALILRYVLPPGTGGRHGGWGGEDPITFLGLARHDWGDVHWYLALALLAFLALHIYLHWRWILRQWKTTFGMEADSAGKTKC